jgi:hypothetical protein
VSEGTSFEALNEPKILQVPSYSSHAEMTVLYEKAREAASGNPGHNGGCEALTNDLTYCSCGIWEAACAGVSVTILALRGEHD